MRWPNTFSVSLPKAAQLIVSGFSSLSAAFFFAANRSYNGSLASVTFFLKAFALVCDYTVQTHAFLFQPPLHQSLRLLLLLVDPLLRLLVELHHLDLLGLLGY
jgi:hypothetical protein